MTFLNWSPIRANFGKEKFSFAGLNTLNVIILLLLLFVKLSLMVVKCSLKWTLQLYVHFWGENCGSSSNFGPNFTFQSAAKESSSEERLTPVVLAQQAAQLKQQLVSAHLDSLLGPQAHINLVDPDGALARWVNILTGQDGVLTELSDVFEVHILNLAEKGKETCFDLLIWS